jgi:hypothetical protein
MAKVTLYVAALDTAPWVHPFEFNWEADEFAGHEIARRVDVTAYHLAYAPSLEDMQEIEEAERELVVIEHNDFPDPR